MRGSSMRSRLFRHYLFRALTPGMVVLIGLIVVFFFRSIEEFAMQERQRVQTRITQACADMDATLSQLQETATRILTNPSLTPYAITHQGNWYQAEQELAKFKPINGIVLDIVILYKDTNTPYHLSPTSTYRKDRFLDLYGLHDPADESVSWLNRSVLFLKAMTWTKPTVSPREVFVYQIPSVGIERYPATVLFVLDRMKFLEPLMRAVDQAPHRIIIQEGEAVVVTLEDATDSLGAVSAHETRGVARYEVPLSKYPWSIHVAVFDSMVNNTMRRFVHDLFPLGVSLLLVLLLLSYTLAIRDYVPIRNIVQRFHASPVPNDHELSLIDRSFSQMENTIREQNEILDNVLLDAMLSHKNCENVQRVFRQMVPVSAAYQILLWSFDQKAEIRTRYSPEEFSQLQMQCAEYINSALETCGKVISTMDSGSDCIYVLFCNMEGGSLERIVDGIRDRIKSMFSVTCTLVIGMPMDFRALDNLSDHFQRLVHGLRYRFLFGCNSALYEDRFSDYDKNWSQEDPVPTASLFAALRQGDVQPLLEQVNHCFGAKPLMPEKARVVYFQLLAIVQRADQELGIYAACQSQIQSLLMDMPETAAQTVDAFQTLANAYALAVKNSRTSQAFPLRDVLIQYIDKHKQDPDLTLQKLSDGCSYSPSYISRYFKEKVGCSFSEYLDALRMTHAEKLLQDTNMAIKEIVQQVGYQDVSNFIRKFKRCHSVTPTAYRTRAHRPSAQQSGLR